MLNTYKQIAWHRPGSAPTATFFSQIIAIFFDLMGWIGLGAVRSQQRCPGYAFQSPCYSWLSPDEYTSWTIPCSSEPWYTWEMFEINIKLKPLPWVLTRGFTNLIRDLKWSSSPKAFFHNLNRCTDFLDFHQNLMIVLNIETYAPIESLTWFISPGCSFCSKLLGTRFPPFIQRPVRDDSVLFAISTSVSVSQSSRK